MSDTDIQDRTGGGAANLADCLNPYPQQSPFHANMMIGMTAETMKQQLRQWYLEQAAAQDRNAATARKDAERSLIEAGDYEALAAEYRKAAHG